MIKNDFYPDHSTIQNDLILTNGIGSLNLTDPDVDPMAAYYMGTVDKNQNLRYRATFKYENGVYKLDRTANIKPNWGYGYTTGGSGYSPAYPAWNGSKWINVGSNFNFINAMKYYKATMTIGAYSVSCYLYDFSNETTLGTGEHIRYTTTRYSGYFNVSVNGIYNFLYSNASWTVTINGTDYTLSLSNWDVNGCYFNVGENKRIYLTQISNASGNNYNCNYYNGHQFYLDLIYAIDSPDRLKSSRGCKIFTTLSHLYPAQIDIDKDYNRAYTGAAPAYGGGNDRVDVDQETVWGAKPFEVTYEVVNYCTTYSPTSHQNEYVINSNDDLVFNSGYSQVRVNNFVDILTWMKLVLGACPKWATQSKADGTAMTYDNNSAEYLPNTAVPMFTRNDSPEGRIIKEDTYRQLEPELRPWQKYGYDITDDEYDPDNPDTPGGDDPDQINPDDIKPTDREDIGDMPENVYNYPVSFKNFTTGYILSAAEVDAVGYKMWSSLSNNSKNMAKNFYLLGDTGWSNDDFYLTMSNIIDYFISLRWYPVSATTLFASSSYSSVTVGAGTYPLLSSGANLIGKWVGKIAAGSVSIPKPTGFYEYEPYATATIYVPFCGTMEVEPSILYGRTIMLDYLVDGYTGSCTAYISAVLESGAGSFLIGSLTGTIGFDVLMTSNNAQTVSARAINTQNTFRLEHAAQIAGAALNICKNYERKSLGGFLNEIKTAFGTAADVAMDAAKARIDQPLLTGLSPLTAGSSFGLSGLLYLTPTIQIRKRSMWNNANGYDSVGFVCDRPIEIHELKNGTYFNCINPNITGIGGATQEELNMIAQYLSNGCFM